MRSRAPKKASTRRASLSKKLVIVRNKSNNSNDSHNNHNDIMVIKVIIGIILILVATVVMIMTMMMMMMMMMIRVMKLTTCRGVMASKLHACEALDACGEIREGRLMLPDALKDPKKWNP